MGVYIKSMEKPENCICCDLSHEDGWCPAKQDYVDRYSFETCPLVPVPAHGRLGDMDAIARKIRRFGDYVDFTKDEIAGWFENGDFETIIPAEGGKE